MKEMERAGRAGMAQLFHGCESWRGGGGGRFPDLTHTTAYCTLSVPSYLADNILQSFRQVGDVGRENRVGQVEAREQLLAVGDLGQVAVRGQHDAAQRVGGALLGALLFQQDLKEREERRE